MYLLKRYEIVNQKLFLVFEGYMEFLLGWYGGITRIYLPSTFTYYIIDT